MAFLPLSSWDGPAHPDVNRKKAYRRRVSAMLAIAAFVVIAALVGLAVVLGWTRDTRQPGREWYPTGPDIRP
jgi:hypothetical protein